MNTTHLPRWLGRGALLTSLGVAVVAFVLSPAAPSAAEEPRPEVKRSELGKNVFFEVERKGKEETRRVIVNAVVVLREGQLEGLLTIKNTKEHEYILGAEVDAVKIHAGLVACGATPGAPVSFKDDKYVAAHGPVVKIFLRYANKDGKTVTVPAQEWVIDGKTKKPLAQDWVFGGSRFYKDPDAPKDKPPRYLANYGDVVCLVNMDDAMLDIPVRSPSRLEERVFEAGPDVPAVGSKVEVIFEPVPEKKKEK